MRTKNSIVAFVFGVCLIYPVDRHSRQVYARLWLLHINPAIAKDSRFYDDLKTSASNVGGDGI
jgi:hypothetical protein